MGSNRLAIVSYWAPPQGAVASHRVLRITRALLAAGHEVHWITLDRTKLGGAVDPTLEGLIPPEVKRHGLGGPCLITKEATDGFIEKVLRSVVYGLPQWFAVPDGYVEWNLRIRRHLARIVRENRIDTLFFCLGPHGALMTIPKLRKKLGDVRILVDYRDLLSGNFWRESTNTRKRDRLLERERHALAASDALFVNTDEAKNRFHEIVQPPAGFPVTVMRNAADYDLADRITRELDAPDLGDGIHIGYFGTVFARRRLTPILEGINALEVELSSRVRFHLFTGGDSLRVMNEDLERVGGAAAKAVVFHEQVPFGEALLAMQDMVALALVNGATEDDRIFVPGKLYDYLMARRPILFVGEVGDAWKIVEECCGSEWCSRHTEPERLAESLRRLAAGRPEDTAPNDNYRPQASFRPLLDMLVD